MFHKPGQACNRAHHRGAIAHADRMDPVVEAKARFYGGEEAAAAAAPSTAPVPEENSSQKDGGRGWFGQRK